MRIRFLGKIGFRNVMNDRVADLVVFHPDSVSATRYPSFSCQAYSFDHWLFAALFLSLVQFSSVQSLSHVRLFTTPWTTARQASLFIINSQSPPKPMSIESVMPSNHLILCCPLLLLLSIFPSVRVFSNESALHIRWPKYFSFSFNISPSSEHPGLISFKMDWLDLLAVQGTLKSLLQHHSHRKMLHSRLFTWKMLHSRLFTFPRVIRD